MSQEIIPLSATQVRSQVNLIQEVMRDVMQKDQHYGIIPGCGIKPTLLKPGAEKLSMVFRLRPIINNGADVRIDHVSPSIDIPYGHREVTVYCHVFNMDGIELATGIGSCSTLESKYRYRGGEKIFTGQKVPTDYWNLKKADPVKALESIGGKGFGVAKNPETQAWEIIEFGEKMENPDIADTYNTVLKIAKKRAYVDGVLSATGASDIFTQDIEDMNPEDVKASPAAQSSKPEVDQPKEKEYLDLVELSKSKKGDKLNIKCFLIASKFEELPDKNDKEKKYKITSYTVGDLPNSPTVQTVIKVFDAPGMFVQGEKVIFNDVTVGEYKEKPQYTAKEVKKNE